MDKHISLYTPSNIDPEILEQIFVQRDKLLDKSVQWCREGLTSKKKNHLLFIGSRGSGKTHMISMIINRLRKEEALNDKMLVVWLGEDDIVTNFLDLVLYILRDLGKEYGFDLGCIEKAKGAKSDKAASMLLECMDKQLDGRKILLIKENMSDVFQGLKDIGQKQLRAYLQEKRSMQLLMTSQQLFEGVSSRDAAFFGFFDIHHLEPLSVDDAIDLIEKVAIFKGDVEIQKFIRTAQGRYRVRALHHLAGGNQRLYMELLDFLTKDSLDDLVSALDKLADELTPYFQERIKSLAPQQGRIVQKLCDIKGAMPVKELAEELFIDQRSVAKQLGDLKAKGYVLAHKRGKQTYYEIAEPLMRLSLQVKHTKGKPLKILVLLIRAWFSNDELTIYQKMKSDTLLKEYAEVALGEDTTIINVINNETFNETKGAFESKDYNKVIELCEAILASPSSKKDVKKILAYVYKGYAHYNLKENELAIEDFTKAVKSFEESELEDDFKIAILLSRAGSYSKNGQFALAIEDCDRIFQFDSFDDLDEKKQGMIMYIYSISFINIQKSAWKEKIRFILDICDKKKMMEYLAVTLILTIKYILDKKEDSSLMKDWQKLWAEEAKKYNYLEPALSALNAMTLALEQDNDKPLFELPKELRELVLPMFEKRLS